MRALNGVFPVLKPIGITSSQFLEVIKDKLRTECMNRQQHIKMGHGGTLDKAAQGVLVAGIGLGCSSLPAFLDGNKQYRTNCLFGLATDTYNSEGTVTMEKPYDHISLKKVQCILRKYVGKIMQKPPPYSALKLGGKRLSDLCRGGVKVDPKPRSVVCYGINITHFSPPLFTLELSCGRGFYVRSLVHDLGIALGSCAYVQELERTVQGPFSLSDCLAEDQISLDAVNKKIADTKEKLDLYLDQQMQAYRKRQKGQKQ